MTNRLHISAAMAALLALQPLALAPLSAADRSAQPADQNAAAEKARKDKPKEKKVCHRELPTGSITPVRICRTQAEIDADAQRGQDQLDAISRARRTG